MATTTIYSVCEEGADEFEYIRNPHVFLKLGSAMRSLKGRRHWKSRNFELRRYTLNSPVSIQVLVNKGEGI